MARQRARLGNRAARATGLLVAALLVGSSCIRTTPFQSDPSVSDLTEKNLAKLAARGPAPRPFKFAAFADTQSDYDRLERTIAAINARDDIELVVIAGDLTELGLLQEYEWSREVYDELDVPWFTAIGNHDALGQGKVIYREMYGPYDYAFSFGGIRFVLFNSNTLEFEGGAPDRDWLRAEVEARAGDRGVILVAHQDLTDPDEYPDAVNRRFYEELVQMDGVAGVVHGHKAEAELLLWHGVPVLQVGTYERVFLHWIVTVDGAELSFEVCQFEACQPGPTPAELEAQ